MVGMIQASADGAAIALLNSASKDVFDDSRLLALCIIGSSIGALLSLAAFPPRDIESPHYNRSAFRKLCVQGGLSMVGGVCMAPACMQWTGIELTSSIVVASSAIVAMLIISVIHAAAPQVPALTAYILERIKNKLVK